MIDRVVAEPGEGAHADPAETARRLRAVILEELDRLAGAPADELSRRGPPLPRFGAFDDSLRRAGGPRGAPSDRASRIACVAPWNPWASRLAGRAGREGRDSRDEPPAREEV